MHPDMSIPEPIKVTLLVTRIFEDLEIPYFIGGSLASAVHGTIRSTLDADLIVDMQIDHFQEVATRLEGEFFIDEYAIVKALQDNTTFNMIHKDTMFRIDVFPLKQHPFDINQMARRVHHSFSNRPQDRAYFTTAEDIILAKLNWFRLGGETSERQWRDVLGIIQVQDKALDQAHLRLWAERLDLLELLERAMSEAIK